MKKSHGAEYLAEALRLLPQLHELEASGAIGSEILALAAVYLPWVCKRLDAHLDVRYMKTESDPRTD